MNESFHLEMGRPEDPPPDGIHRAFKPERLQVIATEIARARASAVEVYDPDAGDGIWSLACVTHQRLINRLSELARSQRYDWLGSVEIHGLRFVFTIGGVPVRHYPTRGRLASANTVRTSELEHALQLKAFDDPEDLDRLLHFRFTHEIGTDLRVRRVYFVGVDHNRIVRRRWSIPFALSEGRNVVDYRKSGVDLGPPPLRAKEKGVNSDGAGRAGGGTS